MNKPTSSIEALASDHKSRKRDAYWQGLVAGDTGYYKARVIDALLAAHFPTRAEAVMDIGCGTSEIALAHATQLGATKVVFMDYDAAVLEKLRAKVSDARAQWLQADIFELSPAQGTFDLVFLLDMLHEVYSFYGRPDRNVDHPVDHALGLTQARRALERVASVVKPGGGLVITDNVLCAENGPVKIKVRTPEARRAVETFLRDYKTRPMGTTVASDGTFTLQARDFCILLTQYNKIKAGEMDRWNVERLEIHQYMTDSEYKDTLEKLGFVYHRVIGTPPLAEEEWAQDFEVIAGLQGIPPKRITLLAVKR